MKLGLLLYLSIVLGLCKAALDDTSTKSTQKKVNTLEKTIKKEKNEVEKFLTELESKINATCKKNGAEDSAEKFHVTYEEFEACYKVYGPFRTSAADALPAIVNCSTGFKKALEDCLTEKEKYFGELFVELRKELEKYSYALVGVLFRDGKFNVAYRDCVYALLEDKHAVQWMKCLRDQFWTEGSDIFTLPPRDKLCQKIKNFDVCFPKVVTNTCEKHADNTEMLKRFINGFETPCFGNTLPDNIWE